jgi:protocatechuate 3,4-dioxygenase beta subunit
MPTRRQLLDTCLKTGALLGASSPLALDLFAQSQDRSVTPANEVGPFYKKGAPNTSNLRESSATGFGLQIHGRIYNTKGNLVEGVTLDIWQADEKGIYDLSGYKYRAKLALPSTAEYKVDSVMPGHYPDRVCQHVHYLIQAPGHKPLVTQLYFATDPVFEGNPAKNFAKDPLVRNPDLIRPVTLIDESKIARAVVNFDLVLERL